MTKPTPVAIHHPRRTVGYKYRDTDGTVYAVEVTTDPDKAVRAYVLQAIRAKGKQAIRAKGAITVTVKATKP